jgi:pyruvate kinase
MQRKNHPVWNRTKIVATMGPACQTTERLRDLIHAGLDVCRLNMSHGKHADHEWFINEIRKINAETGLAVTLLMDLQGPKIRIGNLLQPYPIAPGEEIELCTAITEQQANRLPMEYETFAKDVKPGDKILVEDGRVELRVIETNNVDTVKLLVVSGDRIGSRKGVNLPGVAVSMPGLTPKDLEDLEFGLKHEVDWIALSFVRNPEDVVNLKKILQARGSEARVMAKIEKPEALAGIDEIIRVSDAIMVARGDLGVEIPIEEVPFWQKTIVRKCNLQAKPVVVATQMLDSMIESRQPTRAEVTDVANAVIDGADCVMLSGETSLGKHPVEVVKTMQRIIAQAEREDIIYHRNMELDTNSPTFLSDAVCVNACRLAIETNATALIGSTRSGFTGFQLARCRPKAHIYIFTDNAKLLSTMNLVWGVRAFYYDSFEGNYETIKDVHQYLKTHGYVQTGDIVINTASMPLSARKRTNMIRLGVIE